MRKLRKKQNNQQGFTLMELLIVVAIIAILVAVAIPVYNAQIHKAKVAADWANVRAYYAEIQMDYMTTGRFNSKVPDSLYEEHDHTVIMFPVSGETVTLQAGYCLVTRAADESGYHVSYSCNKTEPGCDLILK